MFRIYFDTAASTPMSKRVLRAMRPYFTKYYGNPSSLHKDGRRASNAIEKARKEIATCLNCSSEEIFFTSGASESNRIACELWELDRDSKLHHSFDYVPQINSSSYLAINLINNETGKNDLSEFRDNFGISTKSLFVDLTQAIGKIPIDLKNMYNKKIFGASFSAHKFGGPKGVGVLYIKKSFQKVLTKEMKTFQEKGIHIGTENVPGIVGMAKALKIATKNYNKNKQKTEKIIKYLYCNTEPDIVKCNLMTLKEDLSSHNVTGLRRVESANNIINITFNNLKAQEAVQLFDQYGISISAGSACNSENTEVSKSLINSGYNEEEALKTIRISVNERNSIKQAKRFLRILQTIIDIYDK